MDVKVGLVFVGPHGPGTRPVVAWRKVEAEYCSATSVTLFAAVVSDCAAEKLLEFRIDERVSDAIDKTMRLTTTNIISAKIKTAPRSSDDRGALPLSPRSEGPTFAVTDH